MIIRLATPADLPHLAAISDSADSAAHWTRQQWLDIFHSQIPARLALVAERPQSSIPEIPVAGFLVAQCVNPEWELENIAVLPAFRQRGVGAALLSALLDEARIRHAERILLEVRASNQSAIRLYTQAGFQLTARRRDYYRNPVEDALLFGRPL
jgi:ribosomal-protein-alanine N-acetyltransferase